MKLSKALTSILAVSSLLASAPALAWGPVGHETVAYIAEDNLTPAAKHRIAAILGRGVRLADVANWADLIRVEQRPTTAPWHFIDIPDRAAVGEGDEPRFCNNHDCVVDQIAADVAVLKSRRSSRRERREALKFLVHFVGDVHQPLHCADDGDRGGNEKLVRFVRTGSRSRRGKKIKLHALWDHLIEVNTVEDPRQLATALEQRITGAERAAWARGTASDWAWESYGIAHDIIYAQFSAGPNGPNVVPLPRDYYDGKMRAVVDLQLEKSGIRLAMILNDVFAR